MQLVVVNAVSAATITFAMIYLGKKDWEKTLITEKKPWMP